MDISTIENIKYGIYPIGLEVRGALFDEYIYRVRPGNGYFGSIKNRKYQDKYAYFIPLSINNPESEPYRKQFKTAVLYWQKNISAEQKAEYNREAVKKHHFAGYHLFIRLCMRGEYHMYVDRGDQANPDFELTDLTLNGSWQDLDLSGIITVQARAILISVEKNSSDVGDYIELKQKGVTNDENTEDAVVKVANLDSKTSLIVSPDTNRKIQYRGSNSGFATLNIVIRGWWT